jgi:hypothetical protein
MKKRWYYIVIGLIVAFIIINPSQGAFKAYLGESSSEGLKRKYNFFVCSIYNYKGYEYLAIAGNFFHIRHEVSSMNYPSVNPGPVRNDPYSVEVFSSTPHKSDTDYSKLSIDSALILFKKKHPK